MSSTISRFIWVDAMLSPNKTTDKSLLLKPMLRKPFLKNKEVARNLHGNSLRSLHYLSMSSMNMHTSNFVRQSNNISPPPEAPLPSGSPSGSLRNWIVGMVLTFILPFFTHKWGSLLLLKNKVDKNIETTEHVVKDIESVAERVDKVLDSITDDLPNDSKLKKALVALDEIVEGVAKGAHVADDIIIKVEEAKGKIESLIEKENSKRVEIHQVDEDKEDQEITTQEENDEEDKQD
uniref:uncharacterized protein LOC122609581 n=1 Tax=Erigeron canadensis TaxID=72917 RepID=UPI001CB919DF|nr:uncharacterized protein LOC122609581 [Erigeron canadensis]